MERLARIGLVDDLHPDFQSDGGGGDDLYGTIQDSWKAMLLSGELSCCDLDSLDGGDALPDPPCDCERNWRDGDDAE